MERFVGRVAAGRSRRRVGELCIATKGSGNSRQPRLKTTIDLPFSIAPQMTWDNFNDWRTIGPAPGFKSRPPHWQSGEI